MPRLMDFPAKRLATGWDAPAREQVPVATEAELLEFVNRARAAGGANVLEALLPSVPSDPEFCLIANGLNFGCRVDSVNDDWAMILPRMPLERAQAIADALGCELDTDSVEWEIRLPEHIGNAAEAFDRGVAFQEFAGGDDVDV